MSMNLKEAIERNQDEIISDLAALVTFPSLAFEGYDPKPNLECAAHVKVLAEKAGFKNVELLNIGSDFPVVWATHFVSHDAPTVLLYGHYDVQPAPEEVQNWESSPWELTKKDDGRYYGRGAADDKSGIVQHFAAIKALGGPDALTGVNVKLCIEGEEEAFGSLEEYVERDPKRFEADIYCIADTGNLEVGKPVLTTSLRGDARLDVTVKTLPAALHSGIFGGPTPDALVELTRLIQTMYDEAGNTVIEGVNSTVWEGADFPEDLFRAQAGLSEDIALRGSGSLGTRLWSSPSATVLAMDVPTLAQSANIIIPQATARISVRFPAINDAYDVLAALKGHLQRHALEGSEIIFSNENASQGFETDTESDHAQLALEVLGEAFAQEASEIGCGASIPLLSVLQRFSPDATFLLFGPEDDEFAKVHSGNESVDLEEIKKCALAEAMLLERLNAH